MTFEHRHENKSCSACRDRVNERVKVAKVVKVTKVVKVAKVARVKVCQVFQNIPGSQLLSDIQTFFLTRQQLNYLPKLLEYLKSCLKTHLCCVLGIKT